MTTLVHDLHVPKQLDRELDPALPTPPTQQEKYSYFGPQHRWLMVVQALSFSLIAYSVARFSTADIRLIVFLVPMTLYAITLVISLTSGTRRRRLTLREHVQTVRSWRPAVLPSVDVFLPSAGEPLDVLANTYSHVARLSWQGMVTVWVLDDAGRSEVEALAEQHGFVYRSRPNRGELKKAGNLRYGYEQSSGDLILVLDADFAPRTDMLLELAPYFDDRGVAIVQSPQFFDTRRPGMHWLQRTAGATQELFYRFIQPSRDRADAAICVGTCAVYRRSALEQAGGFAQIGHSEDVHTGVKLAKAGFKLRYIPVVVAKGLCPDQASAFLNQQYRWCTGSMSLLVDRAFHESPHITRSQKLCFWAGFLYYISTAVNAVVAPLPAIAMLWLLPQWVEPMNSIWLLGAVGLWFFVLPLVMRGRWRVDVLRVQHLYSFAHLVAIVHVMSGRTREWVATGASTPSTPLSVTVGRAVKSFVVVTQVLIWAGLVRGAFEYGLSAYWVMMLFGVLGSYVQLPLLFLRTAPQRARRTAPADTASSPARIPHQRRGSSRVLAVPPPSATAQATARPATRRTLSAVAEPGAVSPRGFRPDIQGLRAIAVVLVVLYHANVPYVSAGYIGVDVFFVISGFLITGQLLREVDRTGRISLLRFYAARIRRLLPSAAVVVAVTLVAARMWDSVFHVRSVAVDALWTLGYGMNYRLAALGVDYQNANGPESPLQHMWSLAVEEQFYIVWPLLILACALVGGRHRRTLVSIVIGFVAAASLYVSVVETSANPSYAYFGLHTRAWELALGALVAMAVAPIGRLPGWVAVPLSWLGLGALVSSAFVFNDQTAFPGVAALLPTLGAAAVIAAGCRRHGRGAESVLQLRPMQGIGRFSYGWYLWHWPMVTLIPMAVGYELSWPYLVEISLIALWFAVVTHYLVEDPSRRSRMRMAGWLGGGALTSGAVAALAGVVMVSLPAFVGTGAAATAVRLERADGAAVDRALVNGLSVMAAPRNLRPAVADASSDVPASSTDGCHAGYLQVDQPACVYGDVHGRHTMVLFGDSHAQQWLPALDREGKKKGWKVIAWTKAACPMADISLVNSELRRDFRECYAWRGKTLDRIERLHPDIVVVSQSDSVPGKQVGTTDWADATVRTLGRLQQQRIPLAYVLDTPLPSGDVPDCVATHLDNVGACNLLDVKPTVYADRMESMGRLLAERKVTTIDPTDFFCTTQACPAVVGNILVYRDASHMSAVYSRWLAPMMSPLFVPRGGTPAAE